jgi:hypothetical protein
MNVFDHDDEAAAAAAGAAAATADYGPPLDQLLTIAPLDAPKQAQCDYRVLGIGERDVEGLIRMATDDRLLWAPSDSTEVWAPVHAWRALGQLRAAEAVLPLLNVVEKVEDDDWVGEELPAVFGEIGQPALEPLCAYLADPSGRMWGRVTAATALKELAVRQPDLRAEVISAFRAHLHRAYRHDATLNGFVAASLLDLNAAEAAPEMEAAFAAGLVDISIAGDWEDMQIELGLLVERTTPRPRFYFEKRPASPIRSLPPTRETAPAGAVAKAARKRKEARKARKRNRRG